MRDDLHSLVYSAPLTIHHASCQPPGTVSIYLSHHPPSFPAPRQTAHLFSSRSFSSHNIFPTLSKTAAQVGRKSSRCYTASKLTTAPPVVAAMLIKQCAEVHALSADSFRLIHLLDLRPPRLSLVIDVALSRKVPHKWVSSSWHFLTTFVALHSIFLVSIKRGHLRPSSSELLAGWNLVWIQFGRDGGRSK